MSRCRVLAGCLLLISGLLHQTLPALAQQTTPTASSDDNP